LGLWLLHYYFFEKVLDGGGWVIVKTGCLAVCFGAIWPPLADEIYKILFALLPI
jgi:hypothetical protein